MTIWNDDLDKIWMDELINQANVMGQRSDSGFKKAAFMAALAKLNKAPGLKQPFNLKQLRSRNDVMKGEFSMVHKMVNTSGMGWEEATCRVVCITTTWDAFFANGANPKTIIWRNKSFPLYHKCCELYAKTLATGNVVISTTGVDTSGDSRGNIVIREDECSDTNENYADTNGSRDEPDISDISDPVRRSRRPAPDDDIDSKSIKKSRSLAQSMVQVFEKYEETASEELEILKALVPRPSSNLPLHTEVLSPSERTLLILQDEFTDNISTDDMAAAFEVMENTTRASLFLHMRGEVRFVWLMRQIRALNPSQY
ncbi:unnamed protein product [Aphanomyces euteiches]